MGEQVSASFVLFAVALPSVAAFMIYVTVLYRVCSGEWPWHKPPLD